MSLCEQCGIPSRLTTGKRPPVVIKHGNVFKRYKKEIGQFRFDDEDGDSVNSSLHSEPNDVLYCYTIGKPNVPDPFYSKTHSVSTFSVKEILSIKYGEFYLTINHAPTECNYSHCLICITKDSVKLTGDALKNHDSYEEIKTHFINSLIESALVR
jgi:hypothetical protein